MAQELSIPMMEAERHMAVAIAPQHGNLEVKRQHMVYQMALQLAQRHRDMLETILGDLRHRHINLSNTMTIAIAGVNSRQPMQDGAVPILLMPQPPARTYQLLLRLQ